MFNNLNKINFLDLTINISNNTFYIKIYRKLTQTDKYKYNKYDKYNSI